MQIGRGRFSVNRGRDDERKRVRRRHARQYRSVVAQYDINEIERTNYFDAIANATSSGARRVAQWAVRRGRRARAITGGGLPTVPSVAAGYTRYLEFDTSRVDAGFCSRYAAWTGRPPYKFLLYEIPGAGDRSDENRILWDGFKPVIDATKQAFKFTISPGINGSGNPVFAPSNENGQSWDSGDYWKGGNSNADMAGHPYVIEGAEYRYGFDIEFSPNFYTQMVLANAGGVSPRWFVLTQLKMRSGAGQWYDQQTISIDSDIHGNDSLELNVNGDPSVTEVSAPYATDSNTVISDLSGKKRIQIDFKIGLGDGYVRVYVDGSLVSDQTDINNRFYMTDNPSTQGALRGPYFGAYTGGIAQSITEPITVWYSNMYIDVKTS